MRTKRGSIIAFSIILLSILLTSGLSVVAVAALEKQSSLSTQKSVVAFQAADSGIERVLKRIYIDNSPSVYTIPLDGTMTDATLQQVAAGLQGVTGASCNVGTNKIVATSSNEPAYTFEVSFFDGSDVLVTCNDTTWRDKAVRLKVEGFYRQTSRVIELGIKPRPICGDSDEETATDEDGNTYQLVQIGTQCWMKENMRVGSRVNVALNGQSDNGVTEYYCYDDQSSNCSSNHPGYPDGGLYTWNEAMQYSTTEGAQGICPNGFRIPTEADWATLELYLWDVAMGSCNPSRVGGADCRNAGTKLGVGGSSGYEANLAGYVSSTAPSFTGRDTGAFYWSSTDTPSAGAIRYIMPAGGLVGYVIKSNFGAGQVAVSVRCIKN